MSQMSGAFINQYSIYLMKLLLLFLSVIVVRLLSDLPAQWSLCVSVC